MVAQRGQAVRLVAPRVFIVAHAQQRAIHQAHDAGYDLLPRQAAPAKVALDAAADRRQGTAERPQPIELAAVAALAPARVIDVLFAPAGIDAGGLQVAIRRGADPYVPPRGRNGELLDASFMPGR